VDKLYWLDQIKPQDRAKVGDKAFHLSRMMQRGYPVLPGFVISEETLRQFLENLNSSEALIADLPYSSLHLDVTNWRQLQQVASWLRQEIISATVPPQLLKTILKAAQEWGCSFLSLRPTIAVPTQYLGNIAGLLESQFCRFDEEAIALALKQTWSQLFRARSLLYWQRLGIDLQQINFAVLVQPLQNAIASGLLNANSDQWEIQATWGLGIAIAKGEVLPDVYYIRPENRDVYERQLGTKILAYRLDEPVSETAAQDTPVLLQDLTTLVTYILEEAQQNQYALPEEYLQQLIHLADQLVKDLGENFTIEWTIPVEPSRTLRITQISASQETISSQDTISNSQLFIKGLGAAGGRVVSTAYVVDDTVDAQQLEQLSRGGVLVASVIALEWLPMLQKLSGIVTEQGGLTSHAAILARELGIPAVVNVPDATVIIQNGERLLVDGDKGEVYRVTRGEGEMREIREMREQNLPHSPDPTPTIATQLLVNLSQPSLIEKAQSLPVDGVGLLRSELMALNILEGQHPNTWLWEGRKTQLLERWCDTVTQFVRGFAPRPVFYRSLDWRSQELLSFNYGSKSSAPTTLGERGTFSYIGNPAIFEMELEAIATIQKAGYTNIQLLLPFVRTVEEFSFCRRKVEQAMLFQVPQFRLWIMAEVPSILFLLPEYVKAGVQGISIGTNDLTQLLLGVDREQGHLTTVFNELHPAVMTAIAQLIQMATTAGIPCSICGQAPTLYPEIIERLIKWGITSISVEPEAVERTHKWIVRAEHKLILQAARQQLKNLD
jgi:pyruvate,water dikinase